MKKPGSALISLLALTTLLALSSMAFFTSQTESSFISLSTGYLNLDMELTNAPEDGIKGLSGGEQSWIPGDHREALVAIKNTGSLPARWRLGVIADSTSEASLADSIIISWYRPDGDGWKLIDSQRLNNMLIEGSSDRWLYDQAMFHESGFQPLAPGGEARLVLQIDFELSAPQELQNQEFIGQLLLQGAQLTGEEWFPEVDVPFNVVGPNAM